MFVFAGTLLVACFVAWCVTDEEPAALLACAATMFVGEAVVSGYIEIQKKRMEESARKAENTDEPPG